MGSAPAPIVERTLVPDVGDGNGTALADRDSVMVLSDLKAKRAPVTLKRGTVIRNIGLTDDPWEIERIADPVQGLVRKTSFRSRPRRSLHGCWPLPSPGWRGMAARYPTPSAVAAPRVGVSGSASVGRRQRVGQLPLTGAPANRALIQAS